MTIVHAADRQPEGPGVDETPAPHVVNIISLIGHSQEPLEDGISNSRRSGTGRW